MLSQRVALCSTTLSTAKLLLKWPYQIRKLPYLHLVKTNLFHSDSPFTSASLVLYLELYFFKRSWA